MCGIIGYVGSQRASEVILKGLETLEYRGYDSVGVAIDTPEGLEVRKDKGMVKPVSDSLSLSSMEGTLGIGHTRWATHGIPCQKNAHPHTDQPGEFAIVHNGVIENYQELRDELKAAGHEFSSETDSEIAAHLISRCAAEGKDTFNAFLSALNRLKGSFAIVLVRHGERKIYAARRNSPLVIGLGEGESFAASDIPALLDYTKNFAALEEDEVAVLSDSGAEFFDLAGNAIPKESFTVDWSREMAEKGGHPHFMLKEIEEQKTNIKETLAADTEAARELLSSFQKVHLIACGTSYHASLMFKYISQKYLGKSCDAAIASEYPSIASPDNETLAIAITQSGETSDTLRAVEYAKSNGAKVLALTNVVGSSITRLADEVVYLNVGPEVSVAATKTFTSQLAVIYKLLFPGKDLSIIPELISKSISNGSKLKEIAEKIKGSQNIFFIGRSLSLPITMEGALKLKEISYLHAEAYPGGELKHGPLSLIEDGVPVIALAPNDDSVYKMLGNIKEVRARGGYVISLTNSKEIESESDITIPLPGSDPVFYPFTMVLPLQMLAYYVSVARGIDPDRPRNLAKSVTVE